MNKYVSILGSTGSIGTQSLEVCEKHGFVVVALAAHSSVKLLAEQVRKFRPKYACIYNEEKYSELKQLLSDVQVELLTGMDGLCRIAALEDNDIVLNSVVGMVGLLPTLTAINAGKDVALANKETLVAGGELVMSLAAEKGVKIYPIDSEHSAVFQCMQGNKREQVRGMILTASGGPIFGYSPMMVLSVIIGFIQVLLGFFMAFEVVAGYSYFFALLQALAAVGGFFLPSNLCASMNRPG